MKRTLYLIAAVTLILAIAACPAFAAGKLVAQNENMHITDSYSVYGYAFAKVQNTGNKAVEFSAGLFELYDEAGDTLTSTDYLSCYPRYLAPDEVGYVYAYDRIEEASSAADVDDYALTVTGKSTEDSVRRFPVVADYQENVQISKYTSYNYVVAEITNDTDETVFNMEVVVVLLDAEDNILYMTHNDYYNTTGINPGSSITYRNDIGSEWYDAWTREGVTPARAEAIAYVEVRNW